MHQQHAIHGRIGERQVILIDQCGERRAARGPTHHALRRRHHGQAPLRLFAEQAEIRRRVANAEHAQRAGVFPARPYAAADQPPGNNPEPLGIKVAQIDDVHTS